MNEAEQSEDLIVEDEVENTEELETEVTESSEEGGDGEESSEEPKQSRSQNAKQRLRRKLREEQALSLQLAEENQKLHEKFSTLESKLDGVINPPAQRPSRVDFDTEEDYEDALLDWKLEKTSKPAAPVESQEKPKPATQNDGYVPEDVRENWLDQVDEAAEKYEDFDDALKSIPAQSMTDAMTRTIMESEKGGEIAYFLGKNHSEAQRISKLSFASQVKEIGKLEDKLSNQSSKAPEPITPTKGTDTPMKDVSKMSAAEYRDYRRKQMAKR